MSAACRAWLAIAAIWAAPGGAAELQGKDWYRLEVIVFERESAGDPGIARAHLLERLVYPLSAMPLAAMRAEPTIIGAHPNTVSNLPPPLWLAGDCISPYWAPPPNWSDRERPVPRDPCLPQLAETEPAPTAAEEPPMPIKPPPALGQARAELADAIRARERELFETSYVWRAELPHLARERRLVGRRFNIVTAGSWHQRLPPRDDPLPLLVQAGEVDDDRFAIEGLFSVTLGRYIHFKAELQRRVAGGIALLSESRRMRSEELHYLDHPALGILVRTDRVETPDNLLALESRVAELEDQPQ